MGSPSRAAPSIQESCQWLCGEMGGMVQVFQNLIGNAIKYRAAQPLQIRVSAAPEGAAWLFAIADNGIGIAPRYHQTIFDLFKRLHGREYSGTGIGLALCKKIIEKHQGRIWVESEAGQGATFKFALPKMKIPPVVRILMAEDNDADVWLFKEALRMSEVSFELERYTDGEACIEGLASRGALAGSYRHRLEHAQDWGLRNTEDSSRGSTFCRRAGGNRYFVQLGERTAEIGEPRSRMHSS